MTTVELTWRESRLACIAGVDRHLMALHDRQRDRNGITVDTHWDADIVGVLGEFVVAKAFDLYWGGADPALYRDGDVARFQVRATPRRDGRLFIKPDDIDDAAFVLVTGVPPCFHIRGWMAARDAKQDRWLESYPPRPPAYFVPQTALHPMDELVEVHRDR